MSIDEEVTIVDRKDHSASRAMVTSLRVKKNPRHWHITVWNRGGQAGILCVEATDGQKFVDALIHPSRQGVKQS